MTQAKDKAENEKKANDKKAADDKAALDAASLSDKQTVAPTNKSFMDKAKDLYDKGEDLKDKQMKGLSDIVKSDSKDAFVKHGSDLMEIALNLGPKLLPYAKGALELLLKPITAPIEGLINKFKDKDKGPESTDSKKPDPTPTASDTSTMDSKSTSSSKASKPADMEMTDMSKSSKADTTSAPESKADTKPTPPPAAESSVVASSKPASSKHDDLMAMLVDLPEAKTETASKPKTEPPAPTADTAPTPGSTGV